MKKSVPSMWSQQAETSQTAVQLLIEGSILTIAQGPSQGFETDCPTGANPSNHELLGYPEF